MAKVLTTSKVKITSNLLVLSARVGTMGVKYVCSVLGFYFLSSADYIDFGIILAAVNLFVLIIGVDMYQMTQRLHVKASKRASTDFFLSELAIGFIILAGLSLVYYLLVNNRFPYFFPLIVIIYCDYVILTASRLVLAKATAVASSLITSFRVLPLLLICIYLLVRQKEANVEHLISIWMIGGIIVAVSTILLVLKRWLIFSGMFAINFKLQDYKTSLLFWLSSVSTYFLLFIDKVIVDNFSEDKLFASSYIFFFSMFSILPAFVDAGIVIPNFKLMLSETSFSKFKKLFRQSLLGCLSLTAILLTVIFIASWAGILKHKLFLLAILAPILVNMFLALNYVPGLFLYANKADRFFFKAHLAQTIFFVVCTSLSLIFNSIEFFLISYSSCYVLLFYVKLKQSRKFHEANYSLQK